jgi:hypothetical protein
MNIEAFEASLKGESPPEELSVPLQALWHAAKGHWEAAHECAQGSDESEAAWVHAHLHREEGDHSNAAYWYRRAGKPVVSGSIEEERHALIAALLKAK